MGIRKSRAVWGLVLLVSVASVAAASDLPLVDATRKGDREAVRSLLKQNVNVNARQPDGATAIAWAAHRNDLETAELLLEAGADVNAANDYGVTPLWIACSDGSGAMVEKLLKAGASANAATWTGQTALMACARTGKLEAVKSLVAREARINVKERQGHSALMWAVAGKHPEVARVLIEHGADVHARSEGGFTPLLFAAQQGDLEAARMLLAAGADVNEATPDGDTPLLVASASGHEAFSIFLLDQGANPSAADRNGITALHYSIMRGLAEITGVTINARYVPYTRRGNMVELAKALLAHGANPNARLTAHTVENDTGPGYGKIHRIDHLNAGGGRIKPAGATPLVLAGRTSDAELMRALVAAGADPDLVTEENVSPLMTAAGIGRGRGRPPLTEEEEAKALEAVKVAVEVLGNDVNAVEAETGMTALHGAAFAGSDRIIQYLVEKGADMNVKDVSGQTPLHKASNIAPIGFTERNLFPYAYRKSTVELLLKLGATPVEDSGAQRSEAGAATAKAPAANQ
jgi:ankyrin repeat protein